MNEAVEWKKFRGIWAAPRPMLTPIVNTAMLVWALKMLKAGAR